MRNLPHPRPVGHHHEWLSRFGEPLDDVYESTVTATGPVLAAVDPARDVAAVLRVASRLASSRASALLVVAVVETALVPELTMFPNDRSINELTIEVFGQAMKVLDVADTPWDVVVVFGNPAREIAHLAGQACASAVVVGAPVAGFRARLRRWFSGDVTRALAHLRVAAVVSVASSGEVAAPSTDSRAGEPLLKSSDQAPLANPARKTIANTSERAK